MSSGQSVVRQPRFTKSNIELISSLKTNFASAQNRHNPHPQSTEQESTDGISQWTTKDDDVLYIPTLRPTPLKEPREYYDITAKLFYLPGIPASRRCRHTKDAIDMVLRELGVQSIDLLIVSYPGVSFDADDDGEEELSTEEDQSDNSDESQGLDAQVKSWQVLETLHEQGTIAQLGVSEFSSDRLEKFLAEVKVKPSVDQINVRDCCVVPKTLILYAKEKQIDLLTHNDCTDILPSGTTREILGTSDNGVGILAATSDAEETQPGLKGEIEPQWVVKYTAVVKDRGVIENKGYFAVAQLGTCIEDKEPVSS